MVKDTEAWHSALHGVAKIWTWLSEQQQQNNFKVYRNICWGGCFVCSVMSNFLWPLWTVGHQASLFMGFFKQEYWSGLPFSSPWDLPDPGVEPRDFCIGRWVLYHLHHLKSLKIPVSSILIKLLSWMYLSSSRYCFSFLCSLPWWKSPWKNCLYLMSSTLFLCSFKPCLIQLYSHGFTKIAPIKCIRD